MNSTRKKLIVGNWKMHLTIAESSMLIHHLDKKVVVPKGVEVALAPSAIALQPVSLQLKHHRKFKLAAQNCYWRDSGPYTGEVSAHMLRGLTQYVIVGHSERRRVFGEHDSDVRHKVQAVVRNQMQPVLCVGENALERADNETAFVLQDQVKTGLANITSEEVPYVVIAYEPIWAIGTGNNANPHDVQDAAQLIREQVKELFGQEASEKVRIIYGGSVDDGNAGGYMALPDIDGLLPGGASLKPDIFAAIVASTATKPTGATGIVVK